MDLLFQKFQQAHYAEYAAWFVDPELDHHLGPMDQEWLDAVLAEPEAEGVTWAVLRNGELVAVVETVFDPARHLSAVISAIAVKPALRQQGVGMAVLQTLLTMHCAWGIDEHIAYVAQDNETARRLIERVGFVLVSSEPDEHGIWNFDTVNRRIKSTSPPRRCGFLPIRIKLRVFPGVERVICHPERVSRPQYPRDPFRVTDYLLGFPREAFV